MNVKCFLPCRKGSERVPYKNIKPFGKFKNGLIEIKLNQLLKAELIDEVVLSTNDELILNYAQTLQNTKLRIHKRDDMLCSSNTSTDELIGHALDLISDATILWTHVTSPFVNELDYDKLIQRYFECLDEGYDSLMTTTLIHSFLWDGVKPINYDPNKEKWPRTQTIKPLHEVNSAAFLNHAENYKEVGDRIGKKPFLYPLDKVKSYEIDWQEDFMIAECIYNSGIMKV